MEDTILQTNHLTVQFGKFTALDDVSIKLCEKHIYGFIGENGAGKTTLMRVLTGLLCPTSGSYSLFGETNPKKVAEMRRYVGSMIEAPALYPSYTAYQNLELQRILLGNPDRNICGEALKMVDLYDVRQKKVRAFSMGMKQRLGIAMAFIGKPRLLILDEPINGLDPKNISVLRNMLKMFHEEKGITLFLSSHILSELFCLATDYMIIHKGRILDMLSQEQLEAKCKKYVKIKTENLPLCLTVIDKELNTAKYKVIDNETVQLYAYTDHVEAVSSALMKHGIIVKELMVSEQSLEEYFLSVTGGVSNDKSV